MEYNEETGESEVNGMSLPVRSRLSVREQAARTADAPVLVTLTDGRQYVGKIQRICNGQLYLAGVEVKSKPKNKHRSGARKKANTSRRQARTSSLVPELQSGVDEATAGTVQAEQAIASAQQGGGFGGFGGLGGLGVLGGLKDWMGFMEKALPMIKMGMGVVKSIIPLLGALKI